MLSAAEEKLKFRLVTRGVDVKVIQISQVEGQVVGAGSFHGVAIFEDGRIVSKEFTAAFDYNKGLGPLYGYSTYTFADGSSISARFEGAATAEPEGRMVRGKYTIVSGTGKYEGAAGTGKFASVKERWENANLFTGEFRVTVP